ncbi:sulfurtransferase-like selenium metabolism protein YedF [Clostridium tarantellae]|uniref:Sulfurtransferase-like selenium metabolism protein YedF n=1 Tax=Clostridium tarantellae TaxID=39493 RepID=A0A6I1MVH7_9CLOT|nr:sulfurtransferase-like selenium metabolism protein YedF [Clostridium tarantellae]MPQ44189.1 sulfurtransferase-like selenium metabolism protein YedF [Clostridium tarantellae]
MKLIDCKGMICPMPVINTKKYFDSIEKGEAKIIVDNEISKDNICKYAIGCGYKVDFFKENDLFLINIEKNNISKKHLNKDENYALLISSDLLGDGDVNLGEILMKGYIYTLSESDIIPEKLVFINSGVKLTVKGSSVLESLNKLIDRGVEILCCGTCLDFYGIKDGLEVGNITNMYTIVEIINSYGKVIKL